jgi:hypothetical protein
MKEAKAAKKSAIAQAKAQNKGAGTETDEGRQQAESRQ